MTTDVQERLVLPPVAPRRMRGARAWIVFFVGVVLAALAIGVVAAVFGNAIKALDGANDANAAAQTALVSAQAQVQAAQDAEDAAQAAIDARRQAIIDDLRSRPQTTTLSISSSSPAFAEVQAMEDSLRTNETAALDAANLARRDAATDAAEAQAGAAEAQNAVDAVTQPLWIVVVASGVVLVILLVVAVSATRRRGRRS